LANLAFDPSTCNNYAIRHVCSKGDWKALDRLLQDKRINPATNNNLCLRWSCRNGFVDAVKLLLNDSRVNPSDKDNYAINWAVSQGHADVVQGLKVIIERLIIVCRAIEICTSLCHQGVIHCGCLYLRSYKGSVAYL
jgi:hypothetical protein